MLGLSIDGLLVACLPATVCLLMSLRPAFFAMPSNLISNRAPSLKGNGWIGPAVILACPAALALMLWLAIHMPSPTEWCAFALTGCAAVWGAYRLAGWPASAITGALVVFSVLKPGLGGHAAPSLLALLAGIGCANAVAITFRFRPLVIFLALYAAADIVLVSSGLTRTAFVHLPAAGALGVMTDSLRPFMRIQLGPVMLGIGDVVYATLVAAVLVARRAPLRQIVFVSLVYMVGMVFVAIWAFRSGAMLPATFPGACALGAMWLVGSRRDRMTPMPLR
jgi:hypothetical protein